MNRYSLCKPLRLLLFPHKFFIWLMLPLTTAIFVFAFTSAYPLSPPAIAAYVLAFYEVSLICLRIPSIIRHYKEFKKTNKYVYRFTSDAAIRVKYSLYMAIALNTGYAIFHVWLGVYHNSFWYFSLAAYYILLDIMRFLLLIHLHASAPCHNMILEHRRSRLCGIILAIMELALATIVVFIVYQNKGAVHAPLTTVALTAYTVFAITLAIVNLVKYRKFRSPIISTAKALSLTAAMVSVLSTETAIFNSFGKNAGSLFRRNITAATGIVICGFVLLLAIGTIIYSSVQIRAIKKGRAENSNPNKCNGAKSE